MAHRSTTPSTQAAVATWKALYAFADGDAPAACEPEAEAPLQSPEAALPDAVAPPPSPEAPQAGAIPGAMAPAAAAATQAQE